MSIAIADVGDFHINEKSGLCAEVVQLDEGGTYHPSTGQREIRECFVDFAEKFHSIPADKHIVFLKGDIADIDAKNRTTSLITRNHAVVQEMVVEALDPLVGLADGIVVFRGTAAHTGKSAWIEEAIANDYDSAIHSEESASWWQMSKTIEGVRFDVAHHAPMPGSPLTYHKASLDLAVRALWYYKVQLNLPPPHIVSRAHMHRLSDSGDNYETRAIFTPAWCLKTEYLYRYGKELNLSDIGGVIYLCDQGKVEVQKIRYPYEAKKKSWESLSL